MKKAPLHILLLFVALFTLTGCNFVGDKATSMSVIYGATTVFSLLMLLCYRLFIKKRDFWFIFLFISIFVVNIGYFILSVSNSLTCALFANRLAYLGSVFLPLSMLIIILNVSKLIYKKWITYLLFAISVLVFLLAATYPYSNLYYTAVSIDFINGNTILNKQYGPLHIIYLFYLLGYFSAIIYVIACATIKKTIKSPAHTIILALTVFSNICVWLLEQLVKIDFEFLSISYIITGFFLITVHVMIENQETLSDSQPVARTTGSKQLNLSQDEIEQKCKFLAEHLGSLTTTERIIYNYHLAGKTTKEILSELNIKENTLKFHNRNIYSKLGVSSRKQLVEYSKLIINQQN